MLHLSQEQALDDEVQDPFRGPVSSNGVLYVLVVDSADDALASKRFWNNTREEAVHEVVSNGLKIRDIEKVSLTIRPFVVYEVDL